MRFKLVAGILALLLGELPAAAQETGFTVPVGFAAETIARVPRVRELSFAPNGDLFAGTLSGDVYIIPRADFEAQKPRVFIHIDDAPVAGVLVHGSSLYIGSQHAVWELAYVPGELQASSEPRKIASVRPGNGRDHITTSLAVARDRLYASVGSSCDACSESDQTRATIQEMDLDGHGMRAKATHIRNAIALAVNPQTGEVWAGVAGQDRLEQGHPYEIFDPFTLHRGAPDYGWPVCYEDRRAAVDGANCAAMTVARVVLPAYDTPIGAVFYPADARGKFAFPREYRGGAFVTLHGSWHFPFVPPRVVYVPMRGDEPVTAVNWSDPGAQWREFMGGFQNMLGSRSGRPTGIGVGPQGSLFVADDYAGAIYRIRPT
jgi:glucose/arabinose dehydrogenase